MKKTIKNENFSDIPNGLPSLFERKDIEKKFNLSERSAQRLLKKWLKDEKIEIFSKTSRKVVFQRRQFQKFTQYQSHFIDQYIPNKTSFLSSSELIRLQEISTLDKSIDLETYQLRLYERLMIDLSWASSRLEGNTYSLLETEKLLVNNEFISGKSTLETQMILNHKEAIKFLVLNRTQIEIDERSIKSVHALLADNLLANLGAIGALRKIPVGISGTDYIPLSVPQLIEEEFVQFIKKTAQVQNPFEQALLILIFIPYIQPFEDINKRTSRLCCNIPLIKNNLIPISFKNVETVQYVEALKDIYEKTNIEKMKALFLESVQFSCQEYRNIVSTLVAPSGVLIKYRSLIKSCVKHCVQSMESPNLKMIESVDQKNRQEVLEQIKKELKFLHEGQLIRFDLKPSEFKVWQSKRRLKK